RGTGGTGALASSARSDTLAQRSLAAIHGHGERARRSRRDIGATPTGGNSGALGRGFARGLFPPVEGPRFWSPGNVRPRRLAEQRHGPLRDVRTVAQHLEIFVAGTGRAGSPLEFERAGRQPGFEPETPRKCVFRHSGGAPR